MELKQIIAKNISNLRRLHGITQAGLAERLNYTDKAVSKWERGESIPDVVILKQIADMFGVTVDYLLSETHSSREDRSRVANHLTIALISCALVYAIATIIYFVLRLTIGWQGLWSVFVCAAPICFILLLIFNSIWGRVRLNFIIITLLLWSALLTVFVFWQNPFIFVLGLPAQVIIVLWTRFHFPQRTDSKNKNK